MCRLFLFLTILNVILNDKYYILSSKTYPTRVNLGKPFLRLGGRIVGGEITNIEELPYQLSLLSYGWHICGASIIAENWALTAAQCVYRSDPEEISFRAGSSIEVLGGSIHQATQIIWHPNYTLDSDYDYALIKVDKSFPIGTPGVNFIALAKVEPKEDQIAIVSGWGSLEDGGPTVNQLQKVEIPIISREICQEMYENYEITERMICAGLAKGGKDFCQGDSGGPLVVEGALVGIVSWGIGCAKPESPGVYSNVVAQLEWIEDTLLIH